MLDRQNLHPGRRRYNDPTQATIPLDNLLSPSRLAYLSIGRQIGKLFTDEFGVRHGRPVDGKVVLRYAGPHTFAHLPRIDQVARFEVAMLGIPVDGGKPKTQVSPDSSSGSESVSTDTPPTYQSISMP
jgi:hypothetical protein